MLDGLNVQQKDAILSSFQQDSLVLAGAGAGKTKVLITRIQYILDVLKRPASSIMAITFTNKASKELLERASKVTELASDMWVGTYHSICIRLLRMFGEEIGLEDFTILDPYNSRKIAQEIMVKLGIVVSKSTVNGYLNRVSSLKNDLITPKKYREKKLNKYKGDYDAYKDDPEIDFIEFYSRYQKENLSNQTVDFDDIILYTILLLNTSQNAKDFVRKTFSYIHADEVQDSNTSNIILINMLSSNCNLFMVGDIDQSIYGFRGARPEYIVKYTDMNKGAKLFKLEQNYRSTRTIVNASNMVVANNDDRIDKVCFSEQEVGDRITYIQCNTDRDEADFLAKEIRAYKAHGEKYSNIMILYRTNSQSRLLEEVFMRENVPYTIVGSLSFNDRAEVKDCLAFLRVAVNKKDKPSFRRALGTLDGIGKKAIEELLSLYDVRKDVLDTLKNYKAKTKRAQESVDFFIDVLNLIDEKPTGVLKKVAAYHESKLRTEGTPKSIEKIENIEELVKVAMEKEDKGMVLKDFVSQMDLLSAKDKEAKDDSVTMMTIHSSKGLESKIVFVTGVNEGILPHNNSLTSPSSIEEERRLVYVAITRAKKKLYMSSFYSNNQKVYDSSRFIEEIPDMYLERI